MMVLPNNPLRLLSLSLVLTGVGCRPPASTPARSVDNLLLITLDTTRADYISCYGGDPGNTPNIDRLAEQGCRFVNAYSQSNMTNPSHVSIMTGLRLIDHGVVNNAARIPEGLDTLSRSMQRAGFRTGAVVSTRHLAADAGWQGFGSLPKVATDFTADVTTDLAIEWLDGNADAPFFLWVHYWDPHAPYDPPPPFKAQFYAGDPTSGDGPLLADHLFFRAKKRTWGAARRWLGRARDPRYPKAMYAAEIHFMDINIGRLLDDLDRRDWRDRTLIVLVADHGECLGEHNILYDHAGLYETVLRVPLIIDAPGAPDGMISTARVTHLDIAPTISDLMNVGWQHPLPGRSLVPLLHGGRSFGGTLRQRTIQECGGNRRVAVRDGKWKLIWPVPRVAKVDGSPGMTTTGAAGSALLDDRLVPNEPLLFDLETDAAERHNVAGQHPQVVAELAEVAAPWVRIGQLRKRDLEHLGEEATSRLRDLGYIDAE